MPGENDPVGEFASTCTEVHAVWFGFTDNLVSLDPSPPDVVKEITGERQYYRLGALAARIVQAAVVAGITYLVLA